MYPSLVRTAEYGEVTIYQRSLYAEYGITGDQHRRLVHEFGAHNTIGIHEAVVARVEPSPMGWVYREPDGLNYR